MSDISELVAVFPANELTVHRLHAKSETFRSICIDYVDATRALEHWKSMEPPADNKIEDYRGIVDELEQEITALIEKAEISEGHRR